MKTLKTLVAVGAILATSATLSQAADGFYFQPTVGVNYSTLDASLSNGSSAIISDSFKGVGISAGARIHDNLGFEVSYTDYGSGEKSTLGTSSSTDVSVIALDGMMYLNNHAGFEPFITAGLGIYDIEISGPGGSVSDNEIGARLGFGAEYHINDDWSVQGTYRHSFVNYGDLDGTNEIAIGAKYTF